ncbi:FadR/GntR family transcriptional regulator [Microbacterium timonense]|uniref:FadR/GntR family transcriptional regulator n=1 Tax=Microbacterium timonense TaxID=2086576 RepID=UPI000D0E7196|nr:FadR/GntR family transcriptional regulator [Microbacterium timonense]
MSNVKLEPVLRPRQQVERQLREAITASEFKSGDRLPTEAELAENFGVSRSTVREALRSLVAEGLITKARGSNGGSFVQTPDHDSLENLLSGTMRTILALGTVSFDDVSSVREMLEVPAARFAAANRSADDLDLLSDVLDRQRTTTVHDPLVPTLDITFHGAIAAASGNRALSAFVAALHRTTQPVTFVRLGPEEGRETVLQHMAIVDAIRKQDADRAAEAMRKHLDYVRDLAL